MNPLTGYNFHVSFSDHYGVALFSPPKKDRGPKPWYFPSDLLSDDFVNNRIRAFFESFTPSDAVQLWENIKIKIHSFIKVHTAFQYKQDRLELSSLHKHLKCINSCIFAWELVLDSDRIQTELRIEHLHEWKSFFEKPEHELE